MSAEKPPQDERQLSGKQRLFADYYLSDAGNFNGGKAARMAGYAESNSNRAAHENLKNPRIRAYIEERLSMMTMPANAVLAKLTRIANSSIEDVMNDEGHFDYELAKKAGNLPLIKKLKRKTTNRKVDALLDDGATENIATELVHEEIEFEMYSSHEALRDLGKFHKLFTDRTEITGAGGTPLFPKDLNLTINKIYSETDDGNDDTNKG